MNIKVYGAPWCPDCRRSKQFLGELRVEYDWIDIDQDAAAVQYVRSVNNGKQIIPTIVFPDGSFLAEPSNDEGPTRGENIGTGKDTCGRLSFAFSRSARRRTALRIDLAPSRPAINHRPQVATQKGTQ